MIKKIDKNRKLKINSFGNNIKQLSIKNKKKTIIKLLLSINDKVGL